MGIDVFVPPSGPDAPEPGPAATPPAPPTAPRPARRRRWPRRTLVGALTVIVVLVAVTGGGYLYLRSRLNGIKRIAVTGLVAPTGPDQIFLVAGSDSRAGESAADVSHFGSTSEVAGQRSDVMVLVRLDTANGTAAMLSIPRDLFVPIAGTNSSNRINVAFDSGPSQLVQTVSQAFGIQINHFAEVGFSGVQQLTDAVGGVCMSFPYPARDGSPTGTGSMSGLDVPTAGQHVLNGGEALALIRSRYYQYFQNGSWHAEGTGDIGRIVRQHEYLRALASNLVHSALHNPFKANSILGKAVGAVTVDGTLSSGNMIGLGWHLRSLRPSGIPSWTMPYRAVLNYGSYGDVLMPDRAADAQVIQEWETYAAPGAPAPTTSAPTTVAGPPPASIQVKVLNGSGVSGQAGEAAAALRARGFQVTGTANSSATESETVVRYHPGQQAEADTVASAVRGPVTTSADATVPAGSVVLVTGRSFGGIAAASSTPTSAASTSSTAAGGGGGQPPGTTPVPPWDPTPC